VTAATSTPVRSLPSVALLQSLDDNSIVALSLGENPAFDPIKYRLVPYGLIGTEGADAPHQLWWGGIGPLRPQTGVYRRDGTLFISCYARDSIPEPTLARFFAHLELLRLDSLVEEIAMDTGARMLATDKIDFIVRQLQSSGRPVFWVDPNAIVRQHPMLPQSLGCDVAFLHRSRCEIETRLLFLPPTAPAYALLEVWRRLSMAYPDLPESFLLDQAWNLTCAQCSIETAWLPRSYGECDPVIREATIELPAMEGVLRAVRCFDNPMADRRFGRAQAPEPHHAGDGLAPQADLGCNPRRLRGVGLRCRHGREHRVCVSVRFGRLLPNGNRAVRVARRRPVGDAFGGRQLGATRRRGSAVRARRFRKAGEIAGLPLSSKSDERSNIVSFGNSMAETGSFRVNHSGAFQHRAVRA
jgi:hypothetical protein